jgi:hypothetical protein
VEARAPSGLFPSGPHRPAYREPHPVRGGAVLTGAGLGAAWLLLSGLLSTSGASYLWLTLGACVAAWLSALVLARFGDRGVAVGLALSAGLGLAIAFVLVLQRWFTTGWPLW